MYKSIITEYGIPWVFNRSLYSAKLRTMKIIPPFENLFEKKVNIKRVDIFQVDVKRIEKFLAEISNIDKEEIVKIADNAMEGKIKAFSSLELNYGNPIEWHKNPITKVEVDKNIKWFKIPDFDPVRGDIKAIWEISRFTHLFYFTRAYMITKDIKYYNSFSGQIGDWINQNPYSYGANYKCGQEATLRMINVLISYSIFKNYGLTTKKDERNLEKLIEGSYKKVLSNFFYAYKCIKNNHTLSEITGLIIGAWCSDDETSLRKAYKLMDEEIKKQFIKDGGYIQYSFNYQRFALQIMEFILKISKNIGFEISEHSKELILNSAFLMYQVQVGNGDLPNYGSNDGALIFPVTTCDYRDFRPVINTIYTLIKGVRIYEYGNYDEEILWFSDFDLDKLPYKDIKKESMIFKESGINVMRHKDGFLMTVLQDFKTRPTQMDQMHIDLWHKNINILCDSGTYSYATELGKEMALTSAHNTVKIDEKDQMKKHGPFLIYDWTSSRELEFSEDHFKGTMISKNGYSHTREILKENQSYVVKDRIVGDFKKAEVLLHTPCKIEKKEYGIDLIYDNKPMAKIITEEKIEIRKKYRSLYYLKKEEINQIVINMNKEKTAKYSIVLID